MLLLRFSDTRSSFTEPFPQEFERFKELISDRTGVPETQQLLSCQGRLLTKERFSNLTFGDVVIVDVSLRISGGKGGFGSLLRGGNSGFVQKKTVNFDACRDLSGRRLRFSSNEQKLVQWELGKEGRALEKKGEEHSNRLERERFRLDKDREITEKLEETSEMINDALDEGLSLPQKRSPPPSLSSQPLIEKKKKWKYRRIETGIEELDDELGLEDSVDLDDSQYEPSEENHPHSVSPSSRSSSEDFCSDSSSLSSEEDKKQNPQLPSTPAEIELLSSSSSEEEKDTLHKSIDLETLSSVKELEQFGPEKLKEELIRRGLISGGTLTQRAERLLSVKGKSRSEINPKLLAKPKKKVKISKDELALLSSLF